MSLQIGKVFSQNKNSFPEDDWISNWRKWNPRISHSNKKVYQNYKKESLDLSPKNSEIFSATSMSGSSKKETKNAENDIKSEEDIKSNSNYSLRSASNNPYFSLHDPRL